MIFVNTQGRHLLDLCIGSRMRIVNGRHGGDSKGKFTCYTPRGCSVVDYLIVSAELQQRIMSFQIAELKSYSDHCPIQFKIEHPFVVQLEKKLSSVPKYRLPGSLLWNDQISTNFRRKFKNRTCLENITELECKFETERNSVASCVNQFSDFLITLVKECGGVRKMNKECVTNTCVEKTRAFPRNKWFDGECKSQKRIVNDAKKLFNALPTDCHLREEYFFQKRVFKKLLKRKKQSAQFQLQMELIRTRNKKPSDFWKLVNKTKQCKDNTIPIDPNVLFEHFKLLNKAECTHLLEYVPVNGPVSELDDEITREEVAVAIGSVKSNKSPGEDGIPIEVYRAFNDKLITLLTKLFNRVLRNGEYPTPWSNGLICPIHKTGEKTNPNNYRGITLLNGMGKIFAMVLHKRISEWAEKRNLLPEEQFGFRKNRRALDCVFILNSIIEDSKRRKCPLFVCYVDFKKAFDRVQHELLWLRLSQLGISSQMLHILQAMYNKASARVKVSRWEATESFPCKIGVRQGCVLSPLLFSLFIGGLIPELAENHAGIMLNDEPLDVLMYADDIVLFSSCAEGMRKQLNSLQNFCKKWQLEVNTDKTKVSVFGKCFNRCSFKLADVYLERVNSYKYLGVWLSTNGSYNKAKKYLSSQSKKAIFSLKTTLSKLQTPSPLVALKLYDVMVKPILCYGCEMWGFKESQELESTEQSFLKFILGLPPNATNAAVRGELGQLPLHLYWKEKILKYWKRICEGNIPTILLHAVSVSEVMSQSGYQACWMSKLREIYNRAGFPSAFNENGFEHIEINIVMSRYRDQFVQQWMEQLNCTSSKRGTAGNKLRTYRLFKYVFGLEPYLTTIKKVNHRIALTRLRTSCQCLQIEVGRYHKPAPIPPDHRLCIICQKVDDEIHFVLECKRYNHLRTELLQSIHVFVPSLFALSPPEMFKCIMQSTHPVIIRALACYTHKAFKYILTND